MAATAAALAVAAAVAKQGEGGRRNGPSRAALACKKARAVRGSRERRVGVAEELVRAHTTSPAHGRSTVLCTGPTGCQVMQLQARGARARTSRG
eukprot:scaffold5297_cov374-Prasinococcus_capsulatus_cf.AAC.6